MWRGLNDLSLSAELRIEKEKGGKKKEKNRTEGNLGLLKDFAR